MREKEREICDVNQYHAENREGSCIILTSTARRPNASTRSAQFKACRVFECMYCIIKGCCVSLFLAVHNTPLRYVKTRSLALEVERSTSMVE